MVPSWSTDACSLCISGQALPALQVLGRGVGHCQASFQTSQRLSRSAWPAQQLLLLRSRSPQAVWLVQVSEGSVVQLMLPFDRGAEERVRTMLQVRLCLQTICEPCGGAAPDAACLP